MWTFKHRPAPAGLTLSLLLSFLFFFTDPVIASGHDSLSLENSTTPYKTQHFSTFSTALIATPGIHSSSLAHESGNSKKQTATSYTTLSAPSIAPSGHSSLASSVVHSVFTSATHESGISIGSYTPNRQSTAAISPSTKKGLHSSIHTNTHRTSLPDASSAFRSDGPVSATTLTQSSTARGYTSNPTNKLSENQTPTSKKPSTKATTSERSIHTPGTPSADSTRASTKQTQSSKASSATTQSTLHSTHNGAIIPTIVKSSKTSRASVTVHDASTITKAPHTTTITGSEATSSISTVSSSIVALIPIINSWGNNPTSLKTTGTLKQVKSVKSEIDSVVSKLGGESSTTGCSSKKRSILGFIGNAVNSLTCIGSNLDNVVTNMKSGDTKGVKSIIPAIESSAKDLDNNEEENDKTKTSKKATKSDRSTLDSSKHSAHSSKTAHSSTTASCTKDTALHITTLCKPTTTKKGDSIRTTTTCYSTHTATITGCSATRFETTVSATASSENYVWCKFGSCNGACSIEGGNTFAPGVSTSIAVTRASGACAAMSTVTTDKLPVATGSTSNGPISTSTKATHSDKRETGLSPYSDSSLSKRMDEIPSDKWIPHVTSLLKDKEKLNWLYYNNYPVTASWIPFPFQGELNLGIRGLFGCTALVVISDQGAYFAHIFEDRIFITEPGKPTSDEVFKTKGFEILRDGATGVKEIDDLVGTSGKPGPLYAGNNPHIYLITPRAGENDRKLFGVTTPRRYQERADKLLEWIKEIIPKSSAEILDYEATNEDTSNSHDDYKGKVILEIRAEDAWLEATDGSMLQAGGWRLWVEGRLILPTGQYYPSALVRRDKDLVSNNKRDSSNELCVSEKKPTTSSKYTKSTSTLKSSNTSKTTAIHTTTHAITTQSSSSYCTSYSDDKRSTEYCVCSSTPGKSTLHATAPLTKGNCKYTKYPTPTMTSKTSTHSSRASTGKHTTTHVTLSKTKSIATTSTTVKTKTTKTTTAKATSQPTTKYEIFGLDCDAKRTWDGAPAVQESSVLKLAKKFCNEIRGNSVGLPAASAGYDKKSKTDFADKKTKFKFEVAWVNKDCVTQYDSRVVKSQYPNAPLLDKNYDCPEMFHTMIWKACNGNGGAGGSVQAGCLKYTMHAGVQ